MKQAAVIWLSFLIASCGLLGLEPEEQADIYALTSADAIHAVQKSAQRLYDTDALSTDDYAEVLIASIRLTDLVRRIESVSDDVGSGAIIVDCVTVSLDGVDSQACSRENIAQILIELREKLK